MKAPTPPSGAHGDVRHLIAQCLQLREERGPGAVDELLADHPDSSMYVRERLDLLGRMGLVGDSPEDTQPERIGSYRIVDVLGRGGMGVVYEAEQERPRRRVALKVLRSWPGEKGRSRFQHEAELLARLQHPGIATIHEVGTASLGGMTVPYFAMELVHGLPVDRYADEAGLDVRARLDLLARITDAVHHAHLKGVVHRDLKPANVLVDERGEPRVLDFGIARAIDPDLELETLRTEVGQLIGTLAYMSPEQAGGDPDEVDARSDVYSLGVIAYELLAGRLPVELDGRPALEALRAIRDEDPQPLGRHDRALRGDVETIVGVALAKEKERRYGSAHELAADIRRHLADEPIAARPATATYQLGKFARRHRALVGGAGVALLALVLGLAGTIYGLFQAARERDDAERRFRQASAVLDFQGRMFTSAEGVQVEDLLDRSLLLVKGSTGDPVEGAAVRLMLGKAYRGTARYDEALELMAEAVEVFERELGRDDLLSLSARTELASLLGHPMGRIEEAERALEGVVETAQGTHGPGHDVTLGARLVQAGLHFERSRFHEAIEIAEDVERLAGPDRSQWNAAKKRRSKSLNAIGETDAALDIAREVLDWHLQALGREHPSTWSAMDALGAMLQNEGRLEDGVPIVEELLELRTTFLGPEHPDTLNAKTNVSMGHYYRGEYERAEELVLEVLEAGESRFAPGHPSRLFALSTLGLIQMSLGRVQDAERTLRERYDRALEVRGPDHQTTLASMNNLAMALQRLNRLDDAEVLSREALATARRTKGDRHRETLITCNNLGVLYLYAGRNDEADPHLREAVEVGREVLDPEDSRLDSFLRSYARNLLVQERFQEAEETLLECRERQDRREAEDHPSKLKTLRLLRQLYAKWGKPEEAEAYRALLSSG